MIQFNLPKEYIAKEPARPRDSARLLVYDRQAKKITDDVFRNINSYLAPQTTLVVNNSKVEQCRWLFDDGKIELFVLEKVNPHTIIAMVRPGKKFKLGAHINLTQGVSALVLAIQDDGTRTIELSVPHDHPSLISHEHVPLPPYIPQNDALADDYQTVYANPVGSKAAPTAGLHFTESLLNKIRNTHQLVELTLHVGLGTFAPLTPEMMKQKRLHSEIFEITAASAAILRDAKHITAVGTTSVRTLESLPPDPRQWSAVRSTTDILISPGYSFHAVDSLITNFHLPGTSLLLLVEAFVGSQSEMQRLYDHAISAKYRFYSFGDAMLIL